MDCHEDNFVLNDSLDGEALFPATRPVEVVKANFDRIGGEAFFKSSSIHTAFVSVDDLRAIIRSSATVDFFEEVIKIAVVIARNESA